MWIDRYYYKLHHPEMPDRDIVSVSICPEGAYKVGDIVKQGDWKKEIVEVVPRIREANEYLTKKWEASS